MIFRVTILLLISFLVARGMAEEEEQKPERPAVTKIGEHRYRLGKIEFDAKNREIFIPVTANMREGGPIEYVLVHENGKIHESVFTTKISPFHLQVAMKLLKFKAGEGDIFNRLLAPEFLEKEGGVEADRGDAVVVQYLEAGKEDRIPAAETIIDGGGAEPMSDEPWVFTGSVMEGGTFVAETEGSIIAIYLDRVSLLNMSREGADLDDRWGANSKAIPEIGAKGTIILSPAKK